MVLDKTHAVEYHTRIEEVKRFCSECSKEFTAKRGSKCLECKRAYGRALYHKTIKPSLTAARKQRIKDVQKQKRVQISQFLYDYLKAHPCVECGERRVACLQFDHLRDKEFNVSDAPHKKYSLERVTKEIDKCRVLCANCHAAHTAVQLGWYADIVQ